MPTQKLRVGVVGAGDVAQVIHLPTLQLLSYLFETKAVCDVSKKTADHCAAIYNIPISTTNPNELFQNPDIDAIIILTSDEYHAPYTIAALQAGKAVLVEKPMTLSLSSAETIIEAEKSAPNNARVFVGYMRRYAASFEAFKREIATIPRIHYVRVRDIIGQNSYFISQSGIKPVKYVDDIPPSAGQDRQQRLDKLFAEAWGTIDASTLSDKQKDYCSLLANLGSHGLSLMREALGGLPEAVLASSDNARWYTTMFDYCNRSAGKERFTCLYETGIDQVPRFDSHVAVFGETKSVTICYDTPFIKGLGITVEIDELNEHGEKVHRSIQTSYEDAYTRELKAFHACITENKAFKTTATDAIEDLKLFNIMLKHHPGDS